MSRLMPLMTAFDEDTTPLSKQMIAILYVYMGQDIQLLKTALFQIEGRKYQQPSDKARFGQHWWFFMGFLTQNISDITMFQQLCNTHCEPQVVVRCLVRGLAKDGVGVEIWSSSSVVAPWLWSWAEVHWQWVVAVVSSLAVCCKSSR